MRVLKEGTRPADRYTLIRRLGAGGMSEVWLGRDRQSESSVALKFLSPELSSNPAYRDLFHKEWQTGIRLMHAHIARVFEFHDDPDGPFYSQQYIAGPDIGVVAGRPVHEALKPFGLIADALRYAHGKGLVHRDIKASNILLDARGSPYLIDFGVAATPAADSAASGGTDIASSPQQLAGEPPTPADDIYALGVLMHETVFGKPPAPVERAKDGGPAGLATADGEPLPQALQRLLGDMLLPEAGTRPSAEEVGHRLHDAGIEAGVASVRVAVTEDTAGSDVAIESVPSIRPLRRGATPLPDFVAESSDVRGVSPKVLYAGLAALALIFVSIFYWLPNALHTDGTDDTATGTVSGEAPVESGEPALTTADDEAGGEEPSAPAAGRATSGADTAAAKAATDETLGELLSGLERLKLRAIERWGGQSYLDAIDVYERGDEAYLDQNYELAGERYREAIELLDPFFDRIDDVFRNTMKAAKAAFAEGNHADAVRLFDLAADITPGDAEAERWLARARNLESVLTLTDQGLRFENELELQAAKLAFEKALELDPAWAPAAAALERVLKAIRQRSFEQRMTEGFNALAAGDYQSARAAFDAAKGLKPESEQPVDGLLQVDQEIRLAGIRRMEGEARELESTEQWQAAILKYQEILDIDPLLQFAQQGLARASEREAIHKRLESYIAEPDSLSAPAAMQAATQLLLQVSRMSPTGPRLEDQKNQLSRLLKRAATPLTVRFVSDNMTEVSIFQVGRLGTFSSQELQLRPGEYTAVGIRPGFRDVRMEFRVAPEIDIEPVVIMCEERI